LFDLEAKFGLLRAIAPTVACDRTEVSNLHIYDVVWLTVTVCRL